MGLGPYERGFLGVMGRCCLTGLGLDGRGCLFGVPFGRVMVFLAGALRWSLGGQGARIRGEERGNLIAGEGHMFWSWSVVAMAIERTGI